MQGADRFGADHRGSALEKWAFALLAIACICQLQIALFYLPAYPGFDDRTLFAAVYSYLQYDRMMYPIYDIPFMYIHPPTKYFLISTLMKCGLSVRVACAVLVIVPFLIFLSGLLVLPAGRLVRVAASLAMTLALTVISFVSYGYELYNHNELLGGLRPDATIVLTWFGGLVWLEAGRRSDWNSGFLALGSILICLAATLHYYSMPSLIALAVYGVAIFWGLKWSRSALKAFAALAAGPVLVLLPFAVVMLPYLKTVASLVGSQAGNSGSVADAWLRHRADLASLLGLAKESFAIVWPSVVLLAPALWLKIPLWALAAFLLVFVKDMRWMVLAAIPVPIAVNFAHHKSLGYYMPEIALFFFSVLFAGAILLDRYVARRWAVHAVALFAVLGASPFLWDRAALRWPAAQAPEDLLRAMSREIIGSSATVVGQFYTSGEKNWVLNGEVLSPGVDYRVEEEWDFRSAATHDAYLAGQLAVAGFVLTPQTPSSSKIFFSKKTDGTKQVGFVQRSENVEKFTEDERGWQFQILHCAVRPEDRLWAPQTKPQIAMYLPHTRYCAAQYLLRSGEPGQFASAFMRSVSGDGTIGANAIVPLLISDELQSRLGGQLLTECGCRVVQTTRGGLSKVPPAELIDKLRASESRIRFFSNVKELQENLSMDEKYWGNRKSP